MKVTAEGFEQAPIRKVFVPPPPEPDYIAHNSDTTLSDEARQEWVAKTRRAAREAKLVYWLRITVDPDKGTLFEGWTNAPAGEGEPRWPKGE
jgi:hypothetical protein